MTNVNLDANGYLASVTNPNSESYMMTYTSGGLLLTFKKPAGQTSTMAYTSDGLLLSDTSSAGNSATLSTAVIGSAFGLSGNAKVFNSTSTLGRSNAYGYQSSAVGTEKNSIVFSDGSSRVGQYSATGDSVVSTANSAPSYFDAYKVEDPSLRGRIKFFVFSDQ